jgi:hypothetical protein
MIKKILFMTVAALLVSPSLMAVPVGTSKAEVKLYKAYISANGDCSSPTVFYDAEDDTDNATRTQDANGNYYIVYDMNGGETITEATITEGTYNCVIFKMSDQITFSPDADEGALCVSGQDYTIDVCWAGESVYDPENETTGNCTSGRGTDDTVWIYISTYSTITAGDPETVGSWTPPTQSGDDSNGWSLTTGTINLTTDMTGTFIFGTDGKVWTSYSQCQMGAPDFGFTVE